MQKDAGSIYIGRDVMLWAGIDGTAPPAWAIPKCEPFYQERARFTQAAKPQRPCRDVLKALLRHVSRNVGTIGVRFSSEAPVRGIRHQPPSLRVGFPVALTRLRTGQASANCHMRSTTGGGCHARPGIPVPNWTSAKQSMRRLSIPLPPEPGTKATIDVSIAMDRNGPGGKFRASAYSDSRPLRWPIIMRPAYIVGARLPGRLASRTSCSTKPWFISNSTHSSSLSTIQTA